MMNWKGFGRKRSWPNFKVLFPNSPGVTSEYHENFSYDSRSPGQDLKPGPPEYEEEVITIQLRRFVCFRLSEEQLMLLSISVFASFSALLDHIGTIMTSGLNVVTVTLTTTVTIDTILSFVIPLDALLMLSSVM
jgi:hypothetical protein